MPKKDFRQELIEKGRLRPARGPRTFRFADIPVIRLPAGLTVQGLIDADRDEALERVAGGSLAARAGTEPQLQVPPRRRTR